MRTIRPLIIKNLIYVKRNIFKTILQLFYPCIIMIIMISFLSSEDKVSDIPEMKFSFLSKNISLFTQENYEDFETSDLLNLTELYFVTSNLLLQRNLSSFLSDHFKYNLHRTKIFNSSDELISFHQTIHNSSSFHSIICVDIVEKDKKINFLIKLNETNYPFTSFWDSINPFNIQPNPVALQNQQFIFQLQKLLADFLININKNTNPIPKFKVQLLPSKSPKFKFDNSFKILFTTILPFFFSVSYISILFKFVLWLVIEKEKKLKDMIFRQGVSGFEYMASWFITFIILVTLPLILNTFLLKEYFLTKTSIFIIFSNLFLYNINILSMALLFQNFCHDIRSSQTFLKIAYVGISFLSIPLANESTPWILRYLFSIFPQVALKYSFEILLQSEIMPNGLDSNLMDTSYKDFTFRSILYIFVFDFILYSVISYVLQNKDYFDFSLWRGVKTKFMNNEGFLFKKIDTLIQSENKCETDLISEQSSVNITIHEEITNQVLLLQDANNENLKIENITKKYDELIAVNNVSLSMFKDQIFVLLGHNGAGKTTMINIISGITDCNNGRILLNKQNLLHNKEYLYRNIGFCSQDNIFYDELTVIENLKIMQEIKGNRVDMHEINELLTNLGLDDKKECLSETLSGGQKRKLCIALALIGNSKLILLDEPTSGMDVTAKRALWGFIKKFKNDKIIILTTHSLEEADYLADRVGIIAEGKLICCGTSSFLKNHFSCGFNVNFLFKNDGDESQMHDSVLTQEKVEIIREMKKIEPRLYIKVLSKESLVINFPEITENCERIFSKIEGKKKESLILNYTVSTTSLEDVFLKVNNNDFSKNLFENELICFHNKDNISSSNALDIRMENLNFNDSKSSLFNEIKLNVIRHSISNYRNKKNIMLEMIASLLSFFVSFLTLSVFFTSTKLICFDKLIHKTSISYSVNGNINKDSEIDLIRRFPQSNNENSPSFNSIDEFDDYLFQNNPYHNNKASIYIREYSPQEANIDIIYSSISTDYGVAALNIVFSEYMEKYFNIKSDLIESIEMVAEKSDKLEKNPDFFFVIYFVILLISAFVNISGYIINTPLKERINNIKHLQYLNGMNMFSYWLSLMIVDLLKYFIFMLIVYPLLLNFTYKFFVSVLPVMIVFSVSLTLFCYCFSHLFDAEENGQKFYLITSYMIMFIYPVIISLVLEKFEIKEDLSFTVKDLFPQSSIIEHLKNIYIAVFLKKYVKIDLNRAVVNAICVFSLQILIFSAVLYSLEKQILANIIHKILSKIQAIPETLRNNCYIQREKDRLSNNNLNLTMKVKEISKQYNTICGAKVLAVNKLNLSLDKNEKFGLLGYNGSGKSTTFKAITKEIFIDEGEIEIFKYKAEKDFEILRQNIGYCPQNSALFDNLTVEETFNFYSKIKGSLNGNVYNDNMLREYGLLQFKHTLSKNLSGGNQRKLNFAIAVMNKPALLLLDEPSTGVDPESRRILWKHINDLQKTNSVFNLVLSTHSLEEAEILCDKIGWMKKGNFICIGNPEKLKFEFSDGYNIQIKFKRLESTDIVLISEYQNKMKNALENLPFLVNVTEINLKEYLIKNDIEGFHYLSLLNRILSEFDNKINSISFLNQFENQLEFRLKFSPEHQGEIFSNILRSKVHDNNILEININIESLEKIFNSLDTDNN